MLLVRILMLVLLWRWSKGRGVVLVGDMLCVSM